MSGAENLSTDEDEIRVIDAIQKLIVMPQAKTIFRYFIKVGDIGGIPPVITDDKLLFRQIGFDEAFGSIFNLLTKADPKTAAELLVEVMKEKINAEAQSIRANHEAHRRSGRY